jgi:hypothetical protein
VTSQFVKCISTRRELRGIRENDFAVSSRAQPPEEVEPGRKRGPSRQATSTVKMHSDKLTSL